jgi:hypothetical protein
MMSYLYRVLIKTFTYAGAIFILNDLVMGKLGRAALNTIGVFFLLFIYRYYRAEQSKD